MCDWCTSGFCMTLFTGAVQRADGCSEEHNQEDTRGHQGQSDSWMFHAGVRQQVGYAQNKLVCLRAKMFRPVPNGHTHRWGEKPDKCVRWTRKKPLRWLSRGHNSLTCRLTAAADMSGTERERERRGEREDTVCWVVEGGMHT